MVKQLLLTLLIVALGSYGFAKPSEEPSVKVNIVVNTDQGSAHESVALVSSSQHDRLQVQVVVAHPQTESKCFISGVDDPSFQGGTHSFIISIFPQQKQQFSFCCLIKVWAHFFVVIKRGKR